MSKFYHFYQNNSYGQWDIHEEKGISTLVIVEANSEKQAMSIAENIGLYFDGVANNIDCPCCGDRWSEPWEYESLESTISIYENGYVHFLNGEIKPFTELSNEA